MGRTDEIANRHLLTSEALNSTIGTSAQYIRIAVEPAWAASIAGQLLTSSLVNLLCRQVKLVREIEVVAAESSRLIRTPDGDQTLAFPAYLAPLARWAVNDAVVVSTTPTQRAADHTIHVGGYVPDVGTRDGSHFIVLGDGWRAWLGSSPNAAPCVTPTSTSPLGPFLAGALAAGEIFKHTRGIRRGRFLTATGLSLWSGAEAATWGELHEGPATDGLTIPPVHMVGAGAVGNSLGYVLAHLGLRDGFLIPIDDDFYDTTNLNRCPLAGWADLDHPKVAAIERSLLAAGVGVYPFPHRLSEYVADARRGLRPDVAASVADLNFEVAVSCVDKGKSRQDIQGLRPRLLVGASTLDLQAKSNLYRRFAGVACLGCYNPAELDGEKIRALESRLRNMPYAERREFLTSHAVDAVSVEEYLAHPQCGGLGEAAIRDLATRSIHEFSVGFVSLAAGVLLAATLLQNSVFSANKPRRADMVTLNFLNGRLGESQLAADPYCELNCQEAF